MLKRVDNENSRSESGSRDAGGHVPAATFPPLAGLCAYGDAARSGTTVAETVRFVRRLARIEHRTLLVLGAHLNAVPEWEAKCALAVHLWQDAEHCGWLRERVPELRQPPHYLDRPDDPALEAFFEELIRARSTRELLTGVYRVLKPNLLEAIDSFRQRSNPLADQPTFRLLRFLELEEREQVGWGEQALGELGGADAEWERHLASFLRRAGGAGGDGDRSVELPAARASEPLELVRTASRLARAPARLRRTRRRGELALALRAADRDARRRAPRPDALRVAGRELRGASRPRAAPVGRGETFHARRGRLRDAGCRLAHGAPRARLRLIPQREARAARATRCSTAPSTR